MRGGGYYIASIFHYDSIKKQLLDEGVYAESIFKIPEELIQQEKNNLLKTSDSGGFYSLRLILQCIAI